MNAEDNPTGLAYLKTFQAMFQIVEFILLFIAWSTIASQPFYRTTGFAFALGTFIVVWLITLFFFVVYIAGLHTRLHKTIRTHPGTTSGTAENLAPPPEAGRFLSGSAWFVVEYIIYMTCALFLFIAVCVVTSNTRKDPYFVVSAIFGWLAMLVFMLHFCLLVRNTEGSWPHQYVINCCRTVLGRTQDTRSSDETTRLTSGATAPPPAR